MPTMTKTEHEKLAIALRDQMGDLAALSEAKLGAKIITVMSGKGGIGKSTIAKELAYALNGVLVDFDWDGGNLTTLFGYDVQQRKGSHLLNAFKTGGVPPFVSMKGRPDLVPGHPDFLWNQPAAQAGRDALKTWAAHWQRLVVVDTHPGGGAEATRGAMGAADVCVMPVVLGTSELNALELDLATFDGYPLLLVPNWVPYAPSAQHMDRLRALAQIYEARIATSYVREHRWMRTRLVRTTICAAPKWGVNPIGVVQDVLKLSKEVASYATA